MIETLLAAALPSVALWLIARRCGDDFRRAATRWFIPLVLLWFAPCWLTGRSPAAFDYLAQEVWPWKQPGFVAGNALLSDIPMQIVPWREVVTRAYRAGEMPFFNRGAGSGSPLWENPQAAVLHPLTLIGIPFSGFAWPLFAGIARILVALTGMYVFLRSRTVSHEAAIFGAIAYGFSAFTIAFLLFPLMNVTAMLPWLLVAIDRAADGWRGAAAFAVVLFLLFAGGHPESVLHAAFFAVPYAIGRRRGALRIIAGGVAGVLLAAPLLIPFALHLPSMERTARLIREPGLLDAPALTVANLSAFVFPYALSERRSPDAPENFNEVATQYAGLAAFLLMIVAIVRQPRRCAWWIAAFALFAFLAFRSRLFDGIPILGQTLHGRVRFLLAFITAVLAAHGFDSLRGLVLRRALPFLLIGDLALVLWSCNPPVARSFYYPSTSALRILTSRPGPFRVLGIRGALHPNSGAIWGIEDVGIHDATSFEPYGRLLTRAGYDRRFYFNTFQALPPKALLDWLGVRFIIAPPGLRSSVLPVVYRGTDATILENASASPRFSSAGVVLEQYGRNGAVVRVESPSPLVVRSGEVALPGWRLTRDGAPWPLRPGTPFAEWTAPAGTSRFELRYVPPGLAAGWLLCAGGLLAVFLMIRRPVVLGIGSSCVTLGTVL